MRKKLNRLLFAARFERYIRSLTSLAHIEKEAVRYIDYKVTGAVVDLDNIRG